MAKIQVRHLNTQLLFIYNSETTSLWIHVIWQLFKISLIWTSVLWNGLKRAIIIGVRPWHVDVQIFHISESDGSIWHTHTLYALVCIVLLWSQSEIMWQTYNFVVVTIWWNVGVLSFIFAFALAPEATSSCQDIFL